MSKQIQVTTNPKQRQYVISCGEGYSCLGWEICDKRANNLAIEMGVTKPSHPLGSFAAYEAYEQLVTLARKLHETTGWTSRSELTPELIGLEGWRVEVVTSWGAKERFIVGRSSGFIPCHIAIAKRNSNGGQGVCGAPFKSLKKLELVKPSPYAKVSFSIFPM